MAGSMGVNTVFSLFFDFFPLWSSHQIKQEFRKRPFRVDFAIVVEAGNCSQSVLFHECDIYSVLPIWTHKTNWYLLWNWLLTGNIIFLFTCYWCYCNHRVYKHITVCWGNFKWNCKTIKWHLHKIAVHASGVQNLFYLKS